MGLGTGRILLGSRHIGGRVVGVYWTPGYWAFAGGGWIWSPGFWGPSVGFYGGINYGFGFFGVGFVGGVWAGNTFAFNTAVTNVNTRIVRNVYFNRVIVRHGTIVAGGRVVGGGTRVRSGTIVGRGTVDRHGTIRGSRVAFDGGHGGISARPTAAQRTIANGKRLGSTSVQRGHVAAAAQNRNNLLAFNHGKPPVTTTRTPITSANRQPDFKPLPTQDRAVAQNQALSKMRVTDGSASGRVVAASHAGTGSRTSQRSSGYRTSSGASRTYAGSHGYGGSHGYSGSRSYGGLSYHTASHGYQGYGGHQAGGFGGHGGGGHGPPRP